jgi:subtilisin family serine protease
MNISTPRSKVAWTGMPNWFRPRCRTLIAGVLLSFGIASAIASTLAGQTPSGTLMPETSGAPGTSAIGVGMTGSDSNGETGSADLPPDAVGSCDPVEAAAARGVLLDTSIRELEKSGRLERTRLMRTPVQPGPVRVVEELTRAAKGAWICQQRHLYLADQIIVRVRPGTDAAQLAQTLRKAGAEPLQCIADNLYAVKLHRCDLKAVPDAIAALTAEGMPVATAEPDGVGFGGGVPNDPQFSTQWGHHNTGQLSGVPDADVDAPEFWDVMESAPGVVIAVLDSGLNFTHPDLQNIAWRNPGEIAGDGADNDGSGRIDDVTGWDFVNSDNNPADDHGHGSNVTGIIAATRNNDTGIAGMISGMQIMVCKVLNSSNSGSTSNLIAATTYARLRGVRIMNLSLQNYPYSGTLDAEFTACRNAGILLCICAGNQGMNNDTTPNYPSSYTHDNIISVANHDRRDERWAGSFNPSNYGAVSVDLFAPGRSILSPVLGTSFSEYTGTSQSAPYVTAVAAAIQYLNPSWQETQIKACLMESSVLQPAYSGRCVTGGRLNALAAVARAVRLQPDNDPDGDGFASLYEYLAGTRMDSAASVPNPAASINAGHLRITLDQVIRPDASFAVERSDDLTTWTTDGVTLFSNDTLLEAGLPLDAAPRGYLRLRPVP